MDPEPFGAPQSYKEELIMASNYQRDKANVDKYRRNNISRVAINIKKDEKALWEQSIFLNV